MIRSLFVTLLASSSIAFAATACSSSSSTTGEATQITGTVGTTSFAAVSTVAAYGTVATVTVSDGGSSTVTNVQGLTISMLDKANTCTDVHAASTHALSFNIPGTNLAPGVFTIVDGTTATPTSGQAEADFFGTTATCTDDGTSESATKGTITLDTVSAASVSGTIQVTFPGGSLSGSFAGSVCATTPDDAGATGDAGTEVCNP